MTLRTLLLSILVTGALGLAACGAEDSASPGTTTGPAQAQATQPVPADAAPAAASAQAMSCPDVPVPGHLAEDVMATGLGCDATVAIANEAEGRRRAPYTSGGFACEPEDAAAGKTNYTCTKADAELTFLYG